MRFLSSKKFTFLVPFHDDKRCKSLNFQLFYSFVRYQAYLGNKILNYTIANR